MTLATLLAVLNRDGVHLEVRGDDLYFRVRRGALTPELRLALQHRKAEIVDVLRGSASADEDADLDPGRELFEERASIMQFEAGLPRAEAERLAHEDVRAQMTAIPPPPSQDDVNHSSIRCTIEQQQGGQPNVHVR